MNLQTPTTALASSASASELPLTKNAAAAAYDPAGRRLMTKSTITDRDAADVEDRLKMFATKIKLPHPDDGLDWTDISHGE